MNKSPNSDLLYSFTLINAFDLFFIIFFLIVIIIQKRQPASQINKNRKIHKKKSSMLNTYENVLYINEVRRLVKSIVFLRCFSIAYLLFELDAFKLCLCMMLGHSSHR